MLETNYPSIIRDLKQLLPASSWPWVFPALRFDPLIWQSLCKYEQVFAVRDLSELISIPEDCSPAALALKALRYPRSAQELRVFPLIPVEPTYREAVEAADGMTLESIKDAALIALNLRQKRLQTGSWNDWTTSLESTHPTALSCLFGLIPDQVEYLQALLPSQVDEDEDQIGEIFQKVIHVLLSNPAPFAVQSELVSILLRSLSPREQEHFIQTLTAFQPALSKNFPDLRSQDHPTSQVEDGSPTTAKGLVEKITTITKQIPRTLKILDQRDLDKKAQQLTQSIQFTAQTQALMLAKLAILSKLNSAESEAIEYWQNAIRTQPHSETLRAIYLLTALSSQNPESLFTHPDAALTYNPETSLLLLASSLLNFQNQTTSLGQENSGIELLAQKAIAEIEFKAANDPFLSDKDIYDYLLALLCEQFIQKGWYALAQQAMSLVQQGKPDRPAFLALMAVLLHAQGFHDQALNLLHLLEALLPQEKRLINLLAQSHAINGEWQAALQIWSDYAPISGDPASLYETIACAHFSHLEAAAIERCTSAHSEAGQEGILLALQAEIDREQNPIQRLELLQQAAELTPSEPYVWLAYARTMHEIEGDQKALDVLKAAEQTLPKNPFIQHALGVLYLENRQPSLALPHLQTAFDSLAEFKPLPETISVMPLLTNEEELPDFIQAINLRFNPDWGSSMISFDQWYCSLIASLGEALLQLGHRKEAHQILVKVAQEYPSHAEVAHQLARYYMSEEKYAEAGQILKRLNNSKSLSAQASTDFARCALQVQELATLDEVILMLQKVLEQNPDHFEALTLLAKALSRTEQPQAALELYDQILRFPQAREHPLKEELAFEMSQAALKAGEYELALTTLLECDQQELSIQQLFAETYFHLGLFKEAANAANSGLSLNESDVENLRWYAHFLSQLAQSDHSHALEYYHKVITALQKALQIAPHAVDLQLALAKAYAQVGDQANAKEILLRFVPENQTELTSTASAADLIKAAQCLIKIGEQNAALACYEKSLTKISLNSPTEVEQTIEILSTMAEIYRQNQRFNELKNVLERAIQIQPDNLSLFYDYLDAWLEVNLTHSKLPFDAQSWADLLEHFEAFREQNVDEHQLSLLYGLFLRWMGDPEKAIEVLNQLITNLISSDGTNNNETRFVILITSITELSRIYRNRGEQQLADYWLNEGIKRIDRSSALEKQECVDLYCDWFEGMLANNRERPALLLEFCNRNPDNLRLIALMCRHKINQDDNQGAKLLFDTAIATLSEPEEQRSSFMPATTKLLALSRRVESLFTIASVARRLGQWNLACELLNQALRYEPYSTRVHWERLQCLVLRAEYQQVCQRLGIEKNAPGDDALAEEARKEFANSLQFLHDHVGFSTAESRSNELLSQEWFLRGQMLFSAQVSAFPANGRAQYSAAFVGATFLANSESNLEELIATATSYQGNPYVQFQIALSVLENQPALAASLVEQLLDQSENISPKSIPQKHWILSVRHFIALVGAIYAKAILNLSSSDKELSATKGAMALEALESSLAFYPDESNWHLLAAQLASLNNSSIENTQKAISHLVQALQGNNPSLDIYIKLAQLYLSIKQAELAIQTLESAAQLDEENPQIDYWLAKAYLQNRQIDLAAQFAQRALEKNPLEIETMILRGEIALQMQDAATALQIAEQALEHPTENPLVWSLFARALHAAGKTDDALRVLEQTIPEKMEFIPLHLERLEIIRQWQGENAALEAANLLLDNFRDSIPLLLFQAEILAQLGQVESAISATQKALRIAHQTSSASLEDHASSHRLLGEFFSRSGHLDQAVYHLSEAIQLMPHLDSTYLLLGDVYLSRGENERALAAYQQCLQLNRENSLAYFKSGVVYKELKDYPNAEQMLRQAARLEPENLAVQRQLGAVVALNLINSQRMKEKKQP
ncbi:MAG: hypothetical protein Kow0088_14480 [Anaerolineales bacterium]